MKKVLVEMDNNIEIDMNEWWCPQILRFGRFLSCGWIRIDQSVSDMEFSFYTWYTPFWPRKNVVLLNGNRNFKIKFEFKIPNSI